MSASPTATSGEMRSHVLVFCRLGSLALNQTRDDLRLTVFPAVAVTLLALLAAFAARSGRARFAPADLAPIELVEREAGRLGSEAAEREQLLDC
jgi:hypothetical protein